MRAAKWREIVFSNNLSCWAGWCDLVQIRVSQNMLGCCYYRDELVVCYLSPQWCWQCQFWIILCRFWEPGFGEYLNFSRWNCWLLYKQLIHSLVQNINGYSRVWEYTFYQLPRNAINLLSRCEHFCEIPGCEVAMWWYDRMWDWGIFCWLTCFNDLSFNVRWSICAFCFLVKSTILVGGRKRRIVHDSLLISYSVNGVL